MTRFPQCRVPYDLSWVKWKLLDLYWISIFLFFSGGGVGGPSPFLKNAGNRLKCPKCWNLFYIEEGGSSTKKHCKYFCFTELQKMLCRFLWKLLETYVDDPKQHNINNNVFIKFYCKKLVANVCEGQSLFLWKTRLCTLQPTRVNNVHCTFLQFMTYCSWLITL